MQKDDVIYRQAAIDLVTDMEFMNNTAKGILRDRLRNLPPAQTTQNNRVNSNNALDTISRQAVLESIKNLYPDMPIVDIMGARRKWLDKYAPYFECENAVEHLPPVNPQPKTGQFAKWVAKEIFDEDWEYNKDAFAEIACRKLARLGIVRAKGGEWELVEPQEREE